MDIMDMIEQFRQNIDKTRKKYVEARCDTRA